MSFENSSAPDPPGTNLTGTDDDGHDDSDLVSDPHAVSRLIGAAIGIVMVQRELSYPDASAFLRALGRDHGQALPDLARDITATGWTRPLRFGPDRKPSRARTAADALDQRLGESMPGQILDLLIETSTLADLLGAITELAVEAVPGCASASITVIRDTTPATIASSDARALSVDQTQYAEGHGPCLHAARTDTIVRIDDLAAAPVRHDAWATAARTAGVSATMSLPIAAGPHIAAALNLYAGTDDGWPQQAQTPAEALAAYTGDAITLSSRLNDPDRHTPPPGPAVTEPAPTPYAEPGNSPDPNEPHRPMITLGRPGTGEACLCGTTG